MLNIVISGSSIFLGTIGKENDKSLTTVPGGMRE